MFSTAAKTLLSSSNAGRPFEPAATTRKTRSSSKKESEPEELPAEDDPMDTEDVRDAFIRLSVSNSFSIMQQTS